MKQRKRIVILGGGFGGAYTLRRLHSLFHGDQSVELVLVNRTNYFLFTPLLHEVATGGISSDIVVEPLRKVLGCCLADLIVGDVKRVDAASKKVMTTSGEISYDYLVVALGSETHFFDVEGALEHCLTLKSLEDALALKNRIIDSVEQAAHESEASVRQRHLTFTIVGGGPTGVELAGEMAQFLRDTFSRYYPPDVLKSTRVVLLQRSDVLVPQFTPYFQRMSLKKLRDYGVDVRLGASLARVGVGGADLVSGEHIATDTVIWTAGVRPCSLDIPGVTCDSRGRIIVNEFLETSVKGVFAIGDIAAFVDKQGQTLPMLAQVATREARIAAENVAARVRGTKMKSFHYNHAGDLLSLGRFFSVAQLGRFSFGGWFAWVLWRHIYLSKLISFPKKIKVGADWFITLFWPRDISRH